VSGGLMFPPERIVCLTEETVETLYLPVEYRDGRSGTDCPRKIGVYLGLLCPV